MKDLCVYFLLAFLFSTYVITAKGDANNDFYKSLITQILEALENYEPESHDDHETEHDPYSYELRDCTFEDLTKCQEESFSDVGTMLTNPFLVPGIVYCSAYSAFFDCVEKLLWWDRTCKDTEELQLEKFLEGTRDVLDNLKRRCQCPDSKDYYYYDCKDACSAQPCQNGGICTVPKPEPKHHHGDDEYYYDYYYYDYYDTPTDTDNYTCTCVGPFNGQRCQFSNDISNQTTCGALGFCGCQSKSTGGPFCNLNCESLKVDPTPILQACIEEGVNVVSCSPLSAPVQAYFAVEECLAATGLQCFGDPAYFLKESLSSEEIKFQLHVGLLDSGNVRVFGSAPVIPIL